MWVQLGGAGGCREAPGPPGCSQEGRDHAREKNVYKIKDFGSGFVTPLPAPCALGFIPPPCAPCAGCRGWGGGLQCLRCPCLPLVLGMGLGMLGACARDARVCAGAWGGLCTLMGFLCSLLGFCAHLWGFVHTWGLGTRVWVCAHTWGFVRARGAVHTHRGAVHTYGVLYTLMGFCTHLWGFVHGLGSIHPWVSVHPWAGAGGVSGVPPHTVSKPRVPTRAPPYDPRVLPL